MHTLQHIWSRKGGAARQGVIRPLLAILLLGLAPWSIAGLHAQEACTSYTFVQPPGSPVGVGAGPNSVVVGDFNRDGSPDLATANANGDTVTILLGDGTGGFTEAAGSPIGVGYFPYSVAVGDFNRDGSPDLATANINGDTVTILLGDGTGGFTEAADSPIGVGNGSLSVAVGDFNHDGTPDLATANIYDKTVTILLGDGTGGFTEALGSPIGIGAQPYSVAVGDFNRDGTPDLVTANYWESAVMILLGDGMGGFTEALGSPVGVGGAPRSVAVGDFNRDGTPDLVTANSPGTVTILLGDGMGGFTEAAGSPVGVGAYSISVAVGDFNHDGTPDLATANPGDNTMTILLGDGMGGFTEAADSPVGVGYVPDSVAVGDFNRDGTPDLVTANGGDSTVTILLNTCTTSQYAFTGFFQPVDNLPVLNQVKAGQGIPLNFSLGGDYGLDILEAGYPLSQPMACSSGAPVDDIEQVVTTSNSGLTYDATTDTYTYVWKTDKGWAGQCRELILRLTDGTDHLAHFQFK